MAPIVLRFYEAEFYRLPAKVREMLRVYHSRQWREGAWVAVEIAYYRWPEIEEAVAATQDDPRDYDRRP